MHILYKCVFGHRFAKQLKTTVTLEYVFILLAATYLRCFSFSFTFSLGYVRMFVCGCAFGVENEKRTNKWNCLKRDHMVPLEPQCSSVCVFGVKWRSRKRNHTGNALKIYAKNQKWESDVIMTACAGGHSVRRSLRSTHIYTPATEIIQFHYKQYKIPLTES